MSDHTIGGALRGVSLGVKRNEGDNSFPSIYERDFYDSMEISDYESEHIKSSVLLDQRDAFYDMLMALETNFNQFLPLNARVGLRPISR